MDTLKPYEIERRSFQIISEELGALSCPAEEAAVLKRVIHTTADFSYAETLYFSQDAVAAGIQAVKNGCTIVTDTNMALSGINKPSLSKGGGRAFCYMADPDIAEAARLHGCTRATLCMDKAAAVEGPLILAVGNAPTALIRLHELIAQGRIKPDLIVGVPVGFVNVVESKELILTSGVPCIVARGRKGGSNVAAAIINAITYLAFPRDCEGI